MSFFKSPNDAGQVFGGPGVVILVESVRSDDQGERGVRRTSGTDGAAEVEVPGVGRGTRVRHAHVSVAVARQVENGPAVGAVPGAVSGGDLDPLGGDGQLTSGAPCDVACPLLEELGSGVGADFDERPQSVTARTAIAVESADFEREKAMVQPSEEGSWPTSSWTGLPLVQEESWSALSSTVYADCIDALKPCSKTWFPSA
ncbi:hypothetical protein [Streptomyces sp. MBT53]|uniref:hypothetical protein n=1 Tax=Streptomyces sp. MBT53 TaxID=1488384 RepID=UPI001913F8FC|nr:hypothetical protein [Streptomyces sp. MBT53]MBK6016841.1 hypothetical protein [Streptomyces sp. MBT53]